MLSMLVASATRQMYSISLEKRYYSSASMLISDLQCYLPSSLMRKTKTEEINLYAWQIHCNISGASPCLWIVVLFADVWWGFFVLGLVGWFVFFSLFARL